MHGRKLILCSSYESFVTCQTTGVQHKGLMGLALQDLFNGLYIASLCVQKASRIRLLVNACILLHSNASMQLFKLMALNSTVI